MNTPYADTLRRAILDRHGPEAPGWLLEECALTLHGAALALRMTDRRADADALEQTIKEIRNGRDAA